MQPMVVAITIQAMYAMQHVLVVFTHGRPQIDSACLRANTEPPPQMV